MRDRRDAYMAMPPTACQHSPSRCRVDLALQNGTVEAKETAAHHRKPRSSTRCKTNGAAGHIVDP